MASCIDDEPSACGSNDDSEGSDLYSLCDSDSDDTQEEDSTSQQGASGGQRFSRSVPCKFYNGVGCRDGRNCPYLHVCRYSLEGNCREGHRCRLRHIADSDSDDSRDGRQNAGARANGSARRRRRRSPSSESELEDGEPYRWQVDWGNGWKNIENDHVLEAHYSQPFTKGINLYNTPKGMISIDFKHMRVLKKRNIKVRRRGSQQTKWIWYYRGKKCWHQYGKKDSKKKHSSIQSSTVEAEYQRNNKGSHQFTVGSDTFEIRFTDMCQKNLTSGQSRKICRRPMYESSRNHGRLTKTMRGMNVSSPGGPARWQFSGSSNRWYDFKQGECSVSSADIEAQYQRNPGGRMAFTIGRQPYEIDFSTMTQINKATHKIRGVQRI